MFRSLYFWVILAIISGILMGWLAPDVAVQMKPLGDGFIKLIKMLIAPVIFCTIVTGIAGMRNMKNAGRVGIKAVLYFEVLTTFALIIGLAVMHIAQPGAGMNIAPESLDAKAIEQYAQAAHEQDSVEAFFLHIIPTSIADAFVKGDMLQILLISLLFAFGILSLGNKGFGLLGIIQQLSDVLFRIIGFIVRLAPIGAFGAMSYTVGKYGLHALTPLLHLMGLFYLTGLLFVAIVLGGIMRLLGYRLWKLLSYLREELLIVLGTSSSEAGLPRLIEKMQQLGCSRSVVGMVVPTGYSFNLDGTCIYLTMAALFIAQATNTHLSFGQELALLGVLLLTSKGAAGVTGSGFVVLAASLSTVGHIPVEGLALILGIDRFMSEARAIVNFIGNAVATLVVSRWENAMDEARVRELVG